jgi:hypothetical protein
MTERKGPARVVSFQKASKPRRVMQNEIAEVSILQAAAFAADQAMQRAVLKIELRIQRGAEIEDGPLTFDRKLHMVRTKKTG